jgi:hypothetical protein
MGRSVHGDDDGREKPAVRETPWSRAMPKGASARRLKKPGSRDIG